MKNRVGVYLAADNDPDVAITKGLQQAQCEIVVTKSVSETLDRIRAYRILDSALLVILVAEVQSGAIPLLILMRDVLSTLPPTLIYDRMGDDIHAVVKALQLGVRDYVLASDPEINREIGARLLVERASAEQSLNAVMTPSTVMTEPVASAADAERSNESNEDQFQWDAIGHVLHLGENYIRLSPIEGRIFDMLLANHNRTVAMEDLVRHVLTNPGVDVDAGVKQLRPHIVRLRRKLERYPVLSNRILNMRGSGYMFI